MSSEGHVATALESVAKTHEPAAGTAAPGADGDLTFGYAACQQTPDDSRRALLVDEIVREAQAVERSGFQSVFVSEHHQRADNYFPSPLVLAAVLARETTRVDIGVAVALLPLYQPLRLVEDATCIDIVAGGRFILGLGPGYVPEDLRLYGMDKAEALERYAEGLEIVTHGWDRGWSYEGRWYRAAIAGITPRPVSSPRPRLWIGANTKGGVERAARSADAWVIGARASLATASAVAPRYHAACAETGKRPRVAVIRDAWIADTDLAAFRDISPYLLRTHLERVRGGFIRDPLAAGVEPETAGPEDFYRIAAGRWLVGDAARVGLQLERWRAEVGASHFILRFRHPTGPPHEAVLEQIHRFGQAIGARAFR